ncbi:MAG: hypothetical protein M3N95_06965 [Actinomycetota bacterium]|nr:hypothetical protein [Actinomycetota bacterium]
MAVLEAETAGVGAEEVVDGAEVLGAAGEADGVLRVVDARCAPNPDVVLEHPASAAQTTSAKAVSCTLWRIIVSPFPRNPNGFVHVIVQETRRDR